jgi:hypothetical protein
MVRNAEDDATQELLRRSLNMATTHEVTERLWSEVIRKFETSENGPLEMRMRRFVMFAANGRTSYEWLVTLWGRTYADSGVFSGYEVLFAGRGKDIAEALDKMVVVPEGK